MPGLRGPELQDLLAKQGVTPPIVYVTGYGDIPTAVRAIKTGAEDFLTKPVSRDGLLKAIERALDRHKRRLDEHDQLGLWRKRVKKLTPREREVFGLVVRGQMNKQIAHQLGLTERTVKAHRRRVMEKLETRSFAHLVSISERLKINGHHQQETSPPPSSVVPGDD
jgi:FixJ family two-component response regulator